MATKKQLREIRHWRGTYRELWDYICELWTPEYTPYLKEGALEDTAELHTWGESANEEIINALVHSDCPFVLMFVVKWEVGGHWYFKVPKQLWDVRIHHEGDKDEQAG